MKKLLGCLCFCFLFMLAVPEADAQRLAVKTNGLMLGAGVPNLGVELVTGKRTSFEVSAFGGFNPYGKNIKIVGGMPEFKYWLSGRPMARFYLGISALATSYKITWNDKVYNGDAAGLGLNLGYSVLLSSRWNLEFAAGVGGAYFRQYKYNAGESIGSGQSIGKGISLIPTKLAVSVSYIIK